MTSKKNSFWRLCFSLLPGAGEMYMGFMKMGVSTMSLFMAVFFIATILEIGPLMIVGMVVWFYSFFHVHNLASLADEEFYSVEDDYIFHFGEIPASEKLHFPNTRKLLAAVLIFTGIVTLWHGMLDLLYELLPQRTYEMFFYFAHDLPRLVIGVGIIYLGVLLIRGKKKEIDGLLEEEEDNNGAQ